MKYDDLGKLLLRLSTLLLLFHGVHKLMYGIGPVEALLRHHGVPALFAWGVYVGEVVAPILIAAGYYARIAALAVAVTMIVAISLTGGFYPLTLTKTGAPTIELALLYLFVSVSIFLIGPGKYGMNRR